jgi:protein-L-isoaspartate(D-aspartate) O-methyltransferase
MKKLQKEFIEFLQKEGIRKEVIDAFKKFDQEFFFDQIFKEYYYSDEPIPIGHGEKFDSSVILAKMLNYLALPKGSRILEIGTGSGYSTAILSHLFKDVVTIEYQEELAFSAKEKLSELEAGNVKFFTGDIMEADDIPGKFDGIIIFAACLSRPHFLTPFLNKDGLIVFPMGPVFQQQIVVMKDEPGQSDDMYKVEYHDICSFSSLRGMY